MHESSYSVLRTASDNSLMTKPDRVPAILGHPSGPMRLLPSTPSLPVCVSLAPEKHHSKGRAMDLVCRMTPLRGTPLGQISSL